MTKRIKLIAVFALIIVAFFVLFNGAYSNYIIVTTGNEYKFNVEPVDPYDVFRGRYVTFRVSGNVPDDVIEKDEYGRLPFDRYYIDEDFAKDAESLTSWSNRDEIDNVYITVKAKNGKGVVTGMYVDNQTIEEYILENRAK